MSIDEQGTAEVLRTIARDERIKQAVLQSGSLYALLLASRRKTSLSR